MIVLDITTSLDGFVSGPNVSIDNPMGDGGEALHHWLFDARSKTDEKVIAELRDNLGAVILGRRTFDVGERPWGDAAPFPVPCFVLTHRGRPTITKQGIPIRFVTEGVDAAVSLAQEAAGARNVLIMGGGETARHYLKAGLIEEIHLHIAHVALGQGTKLFGHELDAQPALQKLRVFESDHVTHIRFRVS